jgi:hypothetical protein
MRKIKITAGDVTAIGVLNDNATAGAIWEALPISARGNTWGEEIYFGIPVHVDEAEDANDVVEMGALAYWPPGNAFCIFFGRTPASKGDECRAASAVNAVGKIEGEPAIFKKVPGGSAVTLEKDE